MHVRRPAVRVVIRGLLERDTEVELDGGLRLLGPLAIDAVALRIPASRCRDDGPILGRRTGEQEIARARSTANSSSSALDQSHKEIAAVGVVASMQVEASGSNIADTWTFDDGRTYMLHQEIICLNREGQVFRIGISG